MIKGGNVINEYVGRLRRRGYLGVISKQRMNYLSRCSSDDLLLVPMKSIEATISHRKQKVVSVSAGLLVAHYGRGTRQADNYIQQADFVDLSRRERTPHLNSYGG